LNESPPILNVMLPNRFMYTFN